MIPEGLKFLKASPPSRGAWIEIETIFNFGDREQSRPPRGGRGLKYTIRYQFGSISEVAPLAGGVD